MTWAPLTLENSFLNGARATEHRALWAALDWSTAQMAETEGCHGLGVCTGRVRHFITAALGEVAVPVRMPEAPDLARITPHGWIWLHADPLSLVGADARTTGRTRRGWQHHTAG